MIMKRGIRFSGMLASALVLSGSMVLMGNAGVAEAKEASTAIQGTAETFPPVAGGRLVFLGGGVAEALFKTMTEADEQSFGPDYVGRNVELVWRTGPTLKCVQETNLEDKRVSYSCHFRVLANGTVTEMPNEF